MRVFDVVGIVSPGARTSTPPGRWMTFHEATREAAENSAELCNRFATVPGIRFVVEEHDEECPGRAKFTSDTHETGPCICGGEHVDS